jgi:hypothetical protein
MRLEDKWDLAESDRCESSYEMELTLMNNDIG